MNSSLDSWRGNYHKQLLFLVTNLSLYKEKVIQCCYTFQLKYVSNNWKNISLLLFGQNESWSSACSFIHYHPNFDGATLGALAETDFLQFSAVVSQLSDGGVYINAGSAVILPEVFLKAIAFCTAQGINLANFYTAVFDFNKHYRPAQIVASRPVLNGGKGYYFVGHHEIMIPLLAAMLLT